MLLQCCSSLLWPCKSSSLLLLLLLTKPIERRYHKWQYFTLQYIPKYLYVYWRYLSLSILSQKLAQTKQKRQTKPRFICVNRDTKVQPRSQAHDEIIRNVTHALRPIRRCYVTTVWIYKGFMGVIGLEIAREYVYILKIKSTFINALLFFLLSSRLSSRSEAI